MQILDEGVVFERLMPGRETFKEFAITNTSQLPLLWTLEGVQDLSAEFTVESTKGELAAFESAQVVVTFKAGEPQQVQHELKLVVQDKESKLPACQTESIKLVAETYTVDVDIQYGDAGETGLNYGTIKVSLCHRC